MQNTPPNDRKRLPRVAWAGILLVPPLLINVWVLLPGGLQVAQTGICPPVPPDIPQSPCSPQDYLVRMTLGPGTFPIQMLLLFGWIGVVVPLGAAIYFAARRLVRPTD